MPFAPSGTGRRFALLPVQPTVNLGGHMKKLSYPLVHAVLALGATGILLTPNSGRAAAPALETPPQSLSSEQHRTERAIDTSHYYIGGNLGLGLIAEGGGGHPELGAAAGLHINRDFSSGFFFSRVPRGSFNATEANGNSIGGSINYYGLEGQYHVMAIPGLQLGAKLALGDNSVDLNGTNNSSTEFYFGPKAAFDYAIGPRTTLGVEANVLFSAADAGRSTALLIAALKFWIA